MSALPKSSHRYWRNVLLVLTRAIGTVVVVVVAAWTHALRYTEIVACDSTHTEQLSRHYNLHDKQDLSASRGANPSLSLQIQLL